MIIVNKMLIYCLLVSAFYWTSVRSQPVPVNVGSRLELLADKFLIEKIKGEARLQLQRPTPREVVLVTDRPWEGNFCGLFTVFQDEELYRMYYRAWHIVTGTTLEFPRRQLICYAESPDGIRWHRPNLGLVEFEGSKENNIILDGLPGGSVASKASISTYGGGVHCFVPFKDMNPAASPDARYKAFSRERDKGLYAWKSPDGIHWDLMTDELVITKGYFDSQNLAFWDSDRKEYREYHRDFRKTPEVVEKTHGIRDIRTSTSMDFIHWTDPVWLSYPGVPSEQLYTNQILPYYRAPHLLMGFPVRYIDRGWSDSMRALPGLEHRRLRAGVSARYGTGLTEGLFMVGRDRISFRRWQEAFIRPGLIPVDNWVYGDNFQNWGLVETQSRFSGAPNELSIYVSEGYWRGESLNLRRFTLRLDGFVAASAPMSGGEITTRPLVFEGNRLKLNLSTSAAGSIQVEMQEADGTPIAGYRVEDSLPIFGDELDRVVSWKEGSDVGNLAGKTVRLRFILKDADLFAFQFFSQ